MGGAHFRPGAEAMNLWGERGASECFRSCEREGRRAGLLAAVGNRQAGGARQERGSGWGREAKGSRKGKGRREGREKVHKAWEMGNQRWWREKNSSIDGTSYGGRKEGGDKREEVGGGAREGEGKGGEREDQVLHLLVGAKAPRIHRPSAHRLWHKGEIEVAHDLPG